MRKFGCAALFAACIAAAPVASASDFFINGQLGQIDLDNSGFDHEQPNIYQGSVGYRWGIGYAQVGLEAGLGKLDDLEDQSRIDYTGGHVVSDYTVSSRYGFIGVNARIKPPVLPVYFVGRAGYLGLKQELEETTIDYPVVGSPIATSRTFDENDGGTYFGVGVGTTVLPLLDVGVMYNLYRYSEVQYDSAGDAYGLSDDKRDARSVSVSVELRF